MPYTAPGLEAKTIKISQASETVSVVLLWANIFRVPLKKGESKFD